MLGHFGPLSSVLFLSSLLEEGERKCLPASCVIMSEIAKWVQLREGGLEGTPGSDGAYLWGHHLCNPPIAMESCWFRSPDARGRLCGKWIESFPYLHGGQISRYCICFKMLNRNGGKSFLFLWKRDYISEEFVSILKGRTKMVTKIVLKIWTPFVNLQYVLE